MYWLWYFNCFYFVIFIHKYLATQFINIHIILHTVYFGSAWFLTYSLFWPGWLLQLHCLIPLLLLCCCKKCNFPTVGRIKTTKKIVLCYIVLLWCCVVFTWLHELLFRPLTIKQQCPEPPGHVLKHFSQTSSLDQRHEVRSVNFPDVPGLRLICSCLMHQLSTL